eukprot:Opistho-2@81652
MFTHAFKTSIRRGFASAAHGQGFEAHAQATATLWKKIFLFVGIPGVGLATFNSVRLHYAHAAHPEHHEFVAYPHMRLRAKPFPWGDGDRSLFYNTHVNLGHKEEEHDH